MADPKNRNALRKRGSAPSFTLRKRGFRSKADGTTTSVARQIRTGGPMFKAPSRPRRLFSAGVGRSKPTSGSSNIFQPGTKLDPSQVKDRRGQKPRIVPAFMRIGHK